MKNVKKGFTLIELLVVIAIIGILAAIAIPQFQAYRQRGFDSSAKSDLRNAATAEEAYFVTNTTYVTCGASNPSGTPGGTCLGSLEGVQSVGVGSTVAMTGSATDFTGTASNSRGTSGVTYTWDSTAGGLQP